MPHELPLAADRSQGPVTGILERPAGAFALCVLDLADRTERECGGTDDVRVAIGQRREHGLECPRRIDLHE